MTRKQPLACGSWPSPITAQSLVDDAAVPASLWSHQGRMWWTESRPAESGRTALVCGGRDLWGSVSVRTRVHSYGGGAWWPDDADGVYACDDADGRLWRVAADGQARPVTPEPAFAHGWRYADGRAIPGASATLCVREDHHGAHAARHQGRAQQEANQIVRIADNQPRDKPGDKPGKKQHSDGPSAEIAEPEVIATGADFYGWPRPSPDGTRLAWVQWNHPNMPWDQTELWVDSQCAVAGTGSVVEPQWGPDGRLYAVSDHRGWWNLYRLDDGELVPVLELDAEMHRPAWVFDDPSYAVCSDNTVAVTALRGSIAELWAVPPDGADPVLVDLPWTSYTSVRPAGPHAVAAIVASPRQEPTAVLIDVADGAYEVIRGPGRAEVDPGYLSAPRPISFATTAGAADAGSTTADASTTAGAADASTTAGAADAGTTAHGLYYPPAHPEATVPAGELPPLLVLGHGGPTGAARSQLQLGIQFWTSRGIAVVDVNYRGSTGYGRQYREALCGLWGISDVDDCVAAARHLVETGEVDGDRLIIRGSSAGGYTTLCALAFHKVFAAGASRYGIADLAALAADTHKFEARYMDALVGRYPEDAEVYEARSPIHSVDGFEAPMIVLQGAEDPVVPPNQAEMIVAALEQRSIPVAYLLFEGEQHGFRQAENIVAALEAELSFFAQILGFDPADDIAPVPIRSGPGKSA